MQAQRFCWKSGRKFDGPPHLLARLKWNWRTVPPRARQCSAEVKGALFHTVTERNATTDPRPEEPEREPEPVVADASPEAASPATTSTIGTIVPLAPPGRPLASSATTHVRCLAAPTSAPPGGTTSVAPTA